MPAKPPVLPLFCQRNSIYLVMFGFVNAFAYFMPGESRYRAMQAFVKLYNLDGIIPPIDTLLMVYARMQNELVEMSKTQAE